MQARFLRSCSMRFGKTRCSCSASGCSCEPGRRSTRRHATWCGARRLLPRSSCRSRRRWRSSRRACGRRQLRNVRPPNGSSRDAQLRNCGNGTAAGQPRPHCAYCSRIAGCIAGISSARARAIHDSDARSARRLRALGAARGLHARSPRDRLCCDWRISSATRCRCRLSIAMRCRNGLRANKGARDVRLCVSDETDVPVAVGLFDAMILIPRSLLDQLSEPEVDQIMPARARTFDAAPTTGRTACSASSAHCSDGIPPRSLSDNSSISSARSHATIGCSRSSAWFVRTRSVSRRWRKPRCGRAIRFRRRAFLRRANTSRCVSSACSAPDATSRRISPSRRPPLRSPSSARSR